MGGAHNSEPSVMCHCSDSEAGRGTNTRFGHRSPHFSLQTLKPFGLWRVFCSHIRMGKGEKNKIKELEIPGPFLRQLNASS